MSMIRSRDASSPATPVPTIRAFDGTKRLGKRSSALSPEANPCESGLWHEAEAKSPQYGLAKKRVVLLGFSGDLQDELMDLLNAERVGLTATFRDARALLGSPQIVCEFDIVIVNLAGYGDLIAGVDSLLAFRACNPAPTVVLVSPTSSGDDLGVDRRPMCDATLALPTTSARFRSGLIAAMENHTAAGR